MVGKKFYAMSLAVQRRLRKAALAVTPPFPKFNSNLSLRCRSLLLLGATLIALAVFFIYSTPPVVAEPDDTITVWSATLTVKEFNAIHDGTGCIDGGLANHACSSTFVLSDNEFTYDGVDYKIEQVFLHPSPRNSQFDFGFNKAATNLKQSGLTLHVDGRKFALANATLLSSARENYAITQWFMPGLSWSVNQQVSLSLKATSLQDQQETPPEEDEHADLIAQMYQWREDPKWRHYKAHTDRWDRALLAFGETVADTTLTPMTAAEAQGYADRGWTRWVEVAATLREEDEYAALIAQMHQWRNDPRWVSYKAHTDRWDRALLAFGETVADTTLTPMAAAEAQGYADRGWPRWVEVAATLRELESGG